MSQITKRKPSGVISETFVRKSNRTAGTPIRFLDNCNDEADTLIDPLLVKKANKQAEKKVFIYKFIPFKTSLNNFAIHFAFV
jgi:hypothetical protein